MSQRRRRAADAMEKTLEVPVVLVTDNDLSSFTSAWPVHPAVPFLTPVHRADYFRIYFLLHYGGGYSDIKNHVESWRPHFKKIIASPSVWMVGVPELKGMNADLPGDNFPPDYYKKLMSNGWFIARPGNDFLCHVLKEQEVFLDTKLDALRAHPGTNLGRCCVTAAEQRQHEYPIGWVELLGMRMSHVSQWYHEHFEKIMKLPSVTDYI